MSSRCASTRRRASTSCSSSRSARSWTGSSPRGRSRSSRASSERAWKSLRRLSAFAASVERMLPRRLAALCLPAAVLALPASASAAVLKDRVLTRAVVAHAAQAAGTTARYPTGDGGTIVVTAEDPAVAQRYATFVGTLPHGSELARLRIVV